MCGGDLPIDFRQEEKDISEMTSERSEEDADAKEAVKRFCLKRHNKKRMEASPMYSESEPQYFDRPSQES